MSRLKNTVGWALRGGEQTRAEFAGQAEAIRDLQRRVSEFDAVVGDTDRLQAEVRGILADLTERIGAMNERIDALESRLGDHDELLSSLARLAAPPSSD